MFYSVVFTFMLFKHCFLFLIFQFRSRECKYKANMQQSTSNSKEPCSLSWEILFLLGRREASKAGLGNIVGSNAFPYETRMGTPSIFSAQECLANKLSPLLSNR